MKTRLYIYAFVLLSFSIFSCTTDDIDEQTETTSNNLKNIANKEAENYLSARENDSIEGDPINPKPIRKD